MLHSPSNAHRCSKLSQKPYSEEEEALGVVMKVTWEFSVTDTIINLSTLLH